MKEGSELYKSNYDYIKQNNNGQRTIESEIKGLIIINKESNNIIQK